MAITLYYNPMSRARITRWLLEELGVPYELKIVGYEDGSMRDPAFLALNPMGKIPTLVDGDVVVTETAAIAIYLADKYKSPNDLAPALDDPQRADYLRWLIFQAACVEPAMAQKGAGFEMPRQQAGWGSFDLVVDVLKQRLAKADPFLLGERFTAADVILGSTVGYAMMFDLFPKEPEFTAYSERLTARPAYARAMEETPA
ncbi:MAG: glutathione S-transferase [Caulobacterales bacterium]|nr:glutathione S-transferase [Caulobacterales bacterium]